MDAFATDIINAYMAICRGFQLQGRCVLQCFAEELDVVRYLWADPGVQEDSAPAVFMAFTDSTGPSYPLLPDKRKRGIQYLRQILKIGLFYCSEGEKEKAYAQICDRWFCANAIQGAGTTILVYGTLPVTLPKGLLLLCDLFRCRPMDLLCFFIEEVVLQVHEKNTDGKAVQFLLYCASQQYQVTHN